MNIDNFRGRDLKNVIKIVCDQKFFNDLVDFPNIIMKDDICYYKGIPISIDENLKYKTCELVYKSNDNFYDGIVNNLKQEAKQLNIRLDKLRNNNEMNGYISTLKSLRETLDLIKKYDWQLMYSEYGVENIIKVKPIFTLHKPDRKLIGELNLYDVTYIEKLNGIDQLTFFIPLKYADIIKNDYLIKLTLNNQSKWFLIKMIDNQIIKNDKISFIAYSLEIQLADFIVSDYNVINKNCTHVLNDILNYTSYSNWSIGYVDPLYDSIFRAFNIKNKTILDSILIDVQEAFGAIVYFDTENKTVSIYNPDSLGFDKGLKFSYKNYLEQINLENKLDNSQFITEIAVWEQNHEGNIRNHKVWKIIDSSYRKIILDEEIKHKKCINDLDRELNKFEVVIDDKLKTL